MKHTDLGTIATWCIWPWKLEALETSGGFSCGDEHDTDVVLQKLTFSTRDEVLPDQLLDEFRCEHCGDYCVDFPRQLPTEEPFGVHQDCGVFFETWGTHATPELIDVMDDAKSLSLIFSTAMFPADIWVEELIENYPEVQTSFIYEAPTYRGELHGADGNIIKRIHESSV